MLTLIMITSSAPLVYSAEGGRVARRLWTETIHELSFAGVDDIVKSFDVA